MSTRNERLNGKTEETDTFLSEINEPVEVILPVDETPITKGMYFESDEDFNAAFKRMDEAHAVELTGEMLTEKLMEINKPYNFLWTGYTTINDKVTGEPRKAAALINANKDSFICASMVVLTAFEKIENEFPVAVRLISLGMKEGKQNKYWNVKVFAL